MWRAFFIAVGFILVIVGLECLVVNRFMVAREARVPEFLAKMMGDDAGVPGTQLASNQPRNISPNVAPPQYFNQGYGGVPSSASQYGQSRLASKYSNAGGKVEVVEYDDGSGYTVVANYRSGIEFNNGTIYNASITLDSGTYTFNIIDRFGCEALFDVIIEKPEEYIVDLGPDIELELGESVVISAETNQQSYIYAWESLDELPCEEDCTEQEYLPTTSNLFSISQ